jgi:hypothetical protein
VSTSNREPSNEWHGAAKDSWFAHVAVEAPSEEASIEWLELAANEEYNRLK